MKKAQGFTLIELMIVVAIIGILAAISLPAYADYTKRAHVTEGLSLMGGAKAGVADYYAVNAIWPGNNGQAGIAAAADITGNAVESVGVGPNGVITATFTSKVDSGATLTLTPTANAGSISWSCGGTLDSKWKPATCR
jgi:type IV pilus assembly protein PilA